MLLCSVKYLVEYQILLVPRHRDTTHAVDAVIASAKLYQPTSSEHGARQPITVHGMHRELCTPPPPAIDPLELSEIDRRRSLRTKEILFPIHSFNYSFPFTVKGEQIEFDSSYTSGNPTLNPAVRLVNGRCTFRSPDAAYSPSSRGPHKSLHFLHGVRMSLQLAFPASLVTFAPPLGTTANLP